jgi:hypothetical protein
LLIAVLVFTWPLAGYFSCAIPAGSEPPAVALFQLFSVEWTGHALGGAGQYWQAPFFWPYRGAFAWCEPQLFSCILIWLVAKLTGCVAAYNLVVVGYLVSFGLVGYCCARLLTRDRLSCLWCGIWLSVGSYALQQICALPLVAAVFPAGCIYFGFLSLIRKRPLFFWLSLAMYLGAWFTCKQTAVFLTLLMPAAFAFHWARPQLRYSDVARLIVAAGIVTACVLPSMLTQLSYTCAIGFSWDIFGMRSTLKLQNLLMPAQGHWLVTHILGWKGYSWSIGIVQIAVCVFALCLGITRVKSPDVAARKTVWGLVAMTVLALLLGFGFKAGVTIGTARYSLYGFLYRIIPGFEYIRTPARFGFFAILGLAVLAAGALAYIRTRLKDPRIRALVTSCVFLLSLTEMWTMPIGLVFPQKDIDDHQEITRWLRDNVCGQSLIELPIPAQRGVKYKEFDTQAMRRMIRHGCPISNGYATFGPVAYKQLIRALAQDPQGQGRRFLQAYGIRYVLLHYEQIGVEQRQALERALPGVVVYSDSNHAVYSLQSAGSSGDIRPLVPSEINFGKIIPGVGKQYRLVLSGVPDRAALIPAQDDWRILLRWIDSRGQSARKYMRLRGSVLMDSNQTRMNFKIQRFPPGAGDIEAVLVAGDGS